MDALTEHLSSYVAGLAYGDIPARAAHGMKVRLIDTIGCAIGGRDGEPVALARELAREASATTPSRTLEKLLVASALAGIAVGVVLGGLLRRR